MRTTTYTWQQAVQDAIGESDVNQLERKIQLAQVAIFERIDTFSATDSGEAIALFDALWNTDFELKRCFTVFELEVFCASRISISSRASSRIRQTR
jgi:hypothetical protein